MKPIDLQTIIKIYFYIDSFNYKEGSMSVSGLENEYSERINSSEANPFNS